MGKEPAMNKKLILFCFVCLLYCSLLPGIVYSQQCPELFPQSNGSVYLVCMPKDWNGDLVIYAHGYVSPVDPVAIPYNQLVLSDGPSIPDLVNGLGYAFATTSYPANGLVVLPAIEDLISLTTFFQSHHSTNHVFLVGVSEGGLIATLAVEQYPTIFSGGMSICGPIGDFRGQVNYWGDFRSVFDYFFPNLMPGTPTQIPPEVLDNQHWAEYSAAIASAVASSNPSKISQLLKVTHAPVNSADPRTILETVGGLLWYSFFATDNAKEVLDGQPFDNTRRLYLGSTNDFLLNLRIFRAAADHSALREIARHYQTTGKLQVPLVSLHTTGDPIVPYWHATLYRLKTLTSKSGFMYSNIPILRYGHANINSTEALAGFALLIMKVTGNELFNVQQVLTNPSDLKQFHALAREAGAIR
jgi:pimeloyl-ACP methyl ester carboxylesterase